MLEHCATYGKFLLLALVPFMLQNVFQSFLVTTEKPAFGLVYPYACKYVIQLSVNPFGRRRRGTCDTDIFDEIQKKNMDIKLILS